MDISISSLFAGFVFSVIGLWLLKEGKRRSQPPVMTIGLIMMLYTYFTSSPVLDWGLGIALTAAAYYFWA